MNFEDILPFLFIAFIILVNVFKAVFSKMNDGVSGKNIRRTVADNRRNSSDDTDDPKKRGFDAYEDARRFVEMRKRAARGDENADDSSGALKKGLEVLSKRSGSRREFRSATTSDNSAERRSRNVGEDSGGFFSDDFGAFTVIGEGKKMRDMQAELDTARAALRDSSAVLESTKNKIHDAYETEDNSAESSAKDAYAVNPEGGLSAELIAAGIKRRNYLREAFVMSEILGKPVSLKRGGDF